MLFEEKSGLPVWYHRFPGKINDVSTLHNLVGTFKALEVGKMHFVMDKGFYSKKNIDDLVGHRDHFTIAVPLSEKWVQRAIDDVHETIHGPEGYRKLDDEILSVHSRLYPWGESRRRCTCICTTMQPNGRVPLMLSMKSCLSIDRRLNPASL